MAEGESYPVRLVNANEQTTEGTTLVFTDASDQPEPGSQFAGWTGTGDPADVDSNGGDLAVHDLTVHDLTSTHLGTFANLHATGIIGTADPGDNLMNAGGSEISNVCDLAISGLTGAVSATRYVGGTADVAPVAGTFAAGDWIVSLTGKLWVCTVGGTPGTWVQANSGTFAPLASPTFTGTVTVPAAAAVNAAPRLSQLSSALTITSGTLPNLGTWTSTTPIQNPVARQITVNVAFVTNGTANAATCAIAISPDNVTYTTIGTLTASTAVNTVGAVQLVAPVNLPAGWYIKLTFVQGTVAASIYY